MERLPPRLQILLDQGLDGQDFWDVCCDHGYLGVAALASGRFTQVHFVDCVPHIINSLVGRLDKSEGPASFLAVRAEELREPLQGTVVIAGVGGFNIINILTKWEENQVLSAQRLLLNPLTHVKELREFLAVWALYREVQTVSVKERSKLREILILELCAQPDTRGF